MENQPAIPYSWNFWPLIIGGHPGDGIVLSGEITMAPALACAQGFHSSAQSPMDDKAIHQREENAKIHLGSVAASKKIDQVETQSY